MKASGLGCLFPLFFFFFFLLVAFGSSRKGEPHWICEGLSDGNRILVIYITPLPQQLS